jgi:truncated hemoglobin YjbI
MRISLAFASLSLVIGMAAVPASAASDSKPAGPMAHMTADELIKDFDAQCVGGADARAKRQDKESLFRRLGGEQKIRALIDELLRQHYRNDALYPLLKNYAPNMLADKLTPFVIERTGGPSVYKGSDLPKSHRNLHITNEMFAAGGGDLIEATKKMGYGPEDTQDLMCFIFSLRSQVVFP